MPIVDTVVGTAVAGYAGFKGINRLLMKVFFAKTLRHNLNRHYYGSFNSLTEELLNDQSSFSKDGAAFLRFRRDVETDTLFEPQITTTKVEPRKMEAEADIEFEVQ